MAGNLERSKRYDRILLNLATALGSELFEMLQVRLRVNALHRIVIDFIPMGDAEDLRWQCRFGRQCVLYWPNPLGGFDVPACLVL